jgi:predicted phage terminase large subunit-like protein
MEQKQVVRIEPQPGPQTAILSTPADIAFYGGAAGGGKTWALLFEAARHVDTPNYYGAIFRREIAQITIQGGLWDESQKLYPMVGANPSISSRKWTFPSGSTIRFEGCEQEIDKLKYQGAQFGFLGFDEVTHFTASQFWYLRSRCRSMTGIRPVVRATCNPDPHSWVKQIIQPWLDGDKQPAELAWYLRENDDLVEVPAGTPDAISITFIPAKVTDNQKLLSADPAYLANLKSLSLADRKALLEGSWEIVSTGNIFKHEWWKYYNEQSEYVDVVRYWDFAATEATGKNDPDYTVGLKLGKTADGFFDVLDVQRFRESPSETERRIVATAAADGKAVTQFFEQEPGSSGKIVVDHYIRTVLSGYPAKAVKKTGSKLEEAKPVSAATENGLVRLPSGAHWVLPFTNEAAMFPSKTVHDDQVDALSGAFNQVNNTNSVYDAFFGIAG